MAARDTLRDLPRIWALLDQLSFVRGDVPEGYRRALQVQKRRRHLTVIAGTKARQR